MAVYNRDNGNINNLPEVRKPSQLANKELGDIIIKSFETVTEALGDGDVPVNSKQIEDAIVKGINRSKLGKMSSVGGVGSNPDSNFEKYYKELLSDLATKREKALQQAEEDAIKKRESEIKEKVDKTFNEINQWASNPLKGFSDTIDKGIKSVMGKFFGKEDKLDPGTQAVVNSNKALGKLLNNPLMEIVTSVSAIGKVISTKNNPQSSVDGINLDDLINGTETTANVMSSSTATRAVGGMDKAAMDALVAEEAAATATTTGLMATTATATTATAASTLEVVAPVVGILAAVGTVAFFLPTIVGGIADLINHSDVRNAELKVQFDALFHGPYSMFTQMKNSLLDALGSVRIGGKKIIGVSSLDKEQQKEFKKLSEQKNTLERATNTMNSIDVDSIISKYVKGGENLSIEEKRKLRRQLINNGITDDEIIEFDMWSSAAKKFTENQMTDEDNVKLEEYIQLSADGAQRNEMLKEQQAQWIKDETEKAYVDLLKKNHSESDFNFITSTGRMDSSSLRSKLGQDFQWNKETTLERLGRKGDDFNSSLVALPSHLFQNIWTGDTGSASRKV